MSTALLFVIVKVEIIQMSSISENIKQIVVYLYNGILLSNYIGMNCWYMQ